MKPRNVLILGGTRFVGKRLVQLCLKAGDKVTLATRQRLTDDFGDRVERLKVDRTAPGSLSSAVWAKDWDIVYDQTCFHAREAREAMHAFSGKVGHYIFTSSAAVYRWNADARSEEDFPPRYFPVVKELATDYAEGKRSAEAVFFREAGFPVTAVRLPVVLGPDDYTRRLEFHFARAIEGLPIVVRNRRAELSLIHADEAAQFLFWVGEKKHSGPINACSHGRISIESLVQRIQGLVGSESPLLTGEKADGMSPFAWPDSLVLDTSLASHRGFSFESLESWLPQRLAACATVSMAMETTLRA